VKAPEAVGERIVELVTVDFTTNSRLRVESGALTA
jgi:hypothetical protein